MKLFGKSHNEPEQEKPESLETAESVVQTGEEAKLVLSFEGNVPPRRAEKAPELSINDRSTQELPDLSQVAQAVENAPEAVEEAKETVEEVVEAAADRQPDAVDLEAVKLAVDEAVKSMTMDPPKPVPPAEPAKPEQPAPAAPKESTRTPSVTYASMAEAMEKSGMKSPDAPSRKERSAIDDETLLAEIYALMGDAPKLRPATAPAARTPAAPASPAAPGVPVVPAAAKDRPAPPPARPRPVLPEDANDQEFRPNPARFERETVRQPRPVEPIEDGRGAPGWLKGIFLLLISTLLSGMTIYAVATDIIGNIF